MPKKKSKRKEGAFAERQTGLLLRLREGGRRFGRLTSSDRARRRGALFLIAATFATVGGARAQDNERQDVSPNTSVIDRFSSQFDSLGWKVGGFTVRPDVSAALRYDDNVFASDADETEDFIGVFTGNVALASNWSVHRLQLTSQINRRQLFDNSSESLTTYRVGGDGTLDVAPRFRISASGGYFDLAEPRTALQSARDADAPVQYSVADAAVNAQWEFTRGELSAGVSYASANFDDATSSVDGSVIDQDFRDVKTTAASARAAFRIRPAIAAFADIQVSKTEYDFPRPGAGGPVFQDSEGYRVGVGLIFDINKVARGEVLAGYERRFFEAPEFSDLSAPSVSAEIEYFLSGLTTITVGGERAIRDSVVFGDGSFVTNQAQIGVDHELLRRLIVSAEAAYRIDDFRGFDRRDNLLTFGVGAQYLLGRQTLVRVDYNFGDLSSSGTFSRDGYQRSIVGLSIDYKF